MNIKAYNKDSLKNKKLAPVIEAIIAMYDWDANTASNLLLVLTKANRAELILQKMLTITKVSTDIKKQPVKFVDVSSSTKPSNTDDDCETCGDKVVKEPKTLEDVLKMGDKTKLLSIAASMGRTVNPGMTNEEIAKVILGDTKEDEQAVSAEEDTTQEAEEVETTEDATKAVKVEPIDLTKLSKADLLVKAKELNIQVNPAMSVNKIIDAIKEATA